MIFFVKCLACCGVYCGFRMSSDSFAWGWVGGVTCAILMRLMETVPA